mmetsp:Transcript_17074/g.66506  ORF Transcript_17074/g.66506 Transcript_17074/m.66506 type:complete len:191 (+) Transcript_17074:1-573(+)
MPLPLNEAPPPPVLPSQYSVATFGLMHGDWSDGRFYYDYDNQQARVDATYNGGFLSMVFDYNTNEGYTMTTFRDQVYCDSFPLLMPLNPPNYLDMYSFAGIAVLPEHGLTYVWESERPGPQVFTFTDAETGEVLVNVSDKYFLGYFDYQDGLPHDMFSYLPSQCTDAGRLPAEAAAARNAAQSIINTFAR